MIFQNHHFMTPSTVRSSVYPTLGDDFLEFGDNNE